MAPATLHAACILPDAPDLTREASLEAARVDTQSYLRRLDGFASCAKADAATLPPLQAKAALDAYADAFVLMGGGADRYNALVAQP